MRTTVLSIFVAAIAGFVFAQETAPRAKGPAVVQAKSFVLVDDAGRKRGEWSMSWSGKPLIQLFDERGKVIWDSTDDPKMKPLLVGGSR